MTSMLIALAIFNALWLITRRARPLLEFKSEASVGWLGLAIVPMRLVAKIATWICALWVFALFIMVAGEHFNGALTALFLGFVGAYAVNLAISRYEQKRGANGATS
jgi:hypothetical protein